jgi:hypothetical protein
MSRSEPRPACQDPRTGRPNVSSFLPPPLAHCGFGILGGNVDPDPFKGGATEVAKRLGVSRKTVFNIRKRRAGPAGHGRAEVLP